MVWELARALVTLRRQVDEHAPGRRRHMDGALGDAAHTSRISDHNPHVRYGRIGIVTALDITHDPGNNVNTWELAEGFRQARDGRLKYVISNKRIFSSINAPWTWRRYTGSNGHVNHIHISVLATRSHYDAAHDWDLRWGGGSGGRVTGEEDSPAGRRVLRQGSRGEEVKVVQRLLQVGSVDGIYGQMTEQAVRNFQRREKITVDGVVGPTTWSKLDTIEQVELPLNYAPPRELSEPE